MEYSHEIIDFGSQIPVKLFIHKVGSVHKHWHQSLELLLVLSGSINIIVEHEIFTLNEDDVILINSNNIHELYSDECIMAALQIKLSMFDNKLIDEKKIVFECNSTRYKNKDRFDNIKSILAEMVKFNSEKSESNEILNKSFAYRILYELVTNFKTNKTQKNYIQTQKHLDRLKRILNYINNNYSQNISLKNLSEMEYLSVPYFSKFFQKNMGINFSSYLNGIRLNYAVNDLLSSDSSIEEIALKNGFPNPRSFVTLFKKEYGRLPSGFRKKNKPILLKKGDRPHENVANYLEIKQSSYLSKLAKHLNSSTSTSHKSNQTPKILQVKSFDVSKRGKKLRHTFKNFTSVGRARDIMLSDIQEMLKTAQKEIGFDHIKFHGLFDDDMMVYGENKKGEVDLNFTHIDKVLDFLLSINLKPFIQFSFMPKQLAKVPSKSVFYKPLITSGPKDMNKWNYLVKSFTQHVIRRYGKEEVLSWLFNVWNEPDTVPELFGFEDSEEFFDYYLNTYRSVKAVNSKILFGSPSLIHCTIENKAWLPEFFEFCSVNNCQPDFIVFHFYSLLDMSQSQFLKEKSNYNSENNPDSLIQFITFFKSWLKSMGYGDTPVYLGEWNSTTNHRDLLNDTCFKAPYIVKNILDNYDRVESFCYWVLSDFIEEFRISKDLFHGGLGLFTHNGIKKPAYFAFYFLNKLGNNMISKGNGFCVTKSNTGIQILLYNYHHYSDLYAYGEIFDMTATDRYTPFPSTRKKEFNICLENIQNGSYSISEYIVNRNYGSCFDKWVEMGAQPLTSYEEIELLKCSSSPMLKKSLVMVHDNILHYVAALDPHEIRFAEIKII